MVPGGAGDGLGHTLAGRPVGYLLQPCRDRSVNASIDRIVGNAAAVLALIAIAVFPQDRWLFLLSLSAMIAVCSYYLTGNTPRKAIFFNAAFNLPIIAFMGASSGAISTATFDLAILRVQETALGVIVCS